MALTRQAAVAGRFYPGTPEELALDVSRYLTTVTERVHVFGCVVPHAGYMYSGHVAGAVYGAIKISKRVVVLGPNHTGRGMPLAINAYGAWRTPLGDVAIDEDLARTLMTMFPALTEDPAAHAREHSVEVQLPFLQCAAGEFDFVPICIGTHDLNMLLALGEAIAGAIQRAGDPILIIASSDMNHYETDDITRIKDGHAIGAILAPTLADAPRALYEAVMREGISMCGVSPTITMLHACALLGAKSGRLIKYATSGDINGDRSSVVGYAGIVVE